MGRRTWCVRAAAVPWLMEALQQAHGRGAERGRPARGAKPAAPACRSHRAPSRCSTLLPGRQAAAARMALHHHQQAAAHACCTHARAPPAPVWASVPLDPWTGRARAQAPHNKHTPTQRHACRNPGHCRGSHKGGQPAPESHGAGGAGVGGLAGAGWGRGAGQVVLVVRLVWPHLKS